MAQTEGFKKPDTAQFTPPAQKDAVERIVAAGMKVMYSPDMRDDVMQAVQSQDPVPQKLAKSVVGLMLMLDSKAKGGLPPEALFPAELELLGEACEVLEAAGQPVTMDDYNMAAQLIFVMTAKKLGATDEQVMSVEQMDEPEAAPGGPGMIAPIAPKAGV